MTSLLPSLGLLLILTGCVMAEMCEKKGETEKVDCQYGCCMKEEDDMDKNSICCEKKTGVLIGVIVGCVVLVVIIVIVVICCCKYKKNKKIRDEHQANANGTSPPGGMVMVPVSYLQQLSQNQAPAPGYGGAPAPGYGGAPAPGYGGAAAPGYGGATAPGYSAALPPGYPGVDNYTPPNALDSYQEKS